MTKKVILTCKTPEELVGDSERKSERQTQIDKMVSEGKTDGIPKFIPPASIELTFVDQSAAEEWLTFGESQLKKYGIEPVSLEIK